MSEKDLTGRRALVCGSSQGIGRAIAFELARRGAAVLLCAMNEEALTRIARELPAATAAAASCPPVALA